MDFDYDEFTCRNIGFVDAREQQRLRDASVLVIGAGGMGGAAVQSLVRAGIGRLLLADIDRFELSNLNRQVFANLDTLGQDKAEATAAALRRINPELQLELLGSDWLDRLDTVLPACPLAINGMDDLIAGIVLYRKAREHGTTVIDAYMSPLPSVTMVRPQAPRPEQRLGWGTQERDPARLTAADAAYCQAMELEYVLTHSSSARHVELQAAIELMQGRRKRMSFAPMVIVTGNLMAFEAVKWILDRRPQTDERGYFFNPWTMRVERPLPTALAWIRRRLVRRFLRKMLDGA